MSAFNGTIWMVRALESNFGTVHASSIKKFVRPSMTVSLPGKHRSHSNNPVYNVQSPGQTPTPRPDAMRRYASCAPSRLPSSFGLSLAVVLPHYLYCIPPPPPPPPWGGGGPPWPIPAGDGPPCIIPPPPGC